MMMNRFIKWPCLLLVMLLFVACEYDYVEEERPDAKTLNAWLLNEGLWNSNNADLSHFNAETGTIDNGVFSRCNERRLGDTGQDILLYGNRLYVSVFASGTIEVVDPVTGVSYRQIGMGGRQPRYLAAHGGKIYVSCYTPHSVVRIDTATFEIEATCNLSGLRPEGMCVVGDSLYVCNSFDQRGNGSIVYDSTLSIVDLTNFEEVERLPIGVNPNHIMPLSASRLAVCCWGDYGVQPSDVVVFDIETRQRHSTGIAATGIAVAGGRLYTFYHDYVDASRTLFYSIDAATLDATRILEQHSTRFVSPYGIAVNPANGNILVTDSQNYRANGDIYCFSPTGTLLWQAEATMGPSRVCFVE